MKSIFQQQDGKTDGQAREDASGASDAGASGGTVVPDLEMTEAPMPDLEMAGSPKPGGEVAGSARPDLEAAAPGAPGMKLAAPSTPDLEVVHSPGPDLEVGVSAMPDLEVESAPMPDLEAAGPATPDLEAASMAVPDLEMAAAPKPDLEAAGSAEAVSPVSSRPSGEGEFLLEFGDFAPRIPSHLMRHGAQDARIPIPIPMGEIAECIASGNTTILLSELFRRLPKVFLGAIPPFEDIPILYPWQKIGRLLTAAAAAKGTPQGELLQQLVRATAAAREAHAQKLAGKSAPAGKKAAEAESAPPKPVARVSPGTPAKAPAAGSAPPGSGPVAAEPAAAANFEQQMEVRLAAMRESHARELTKLHAERETAVARVTAESTRALEELQREYEERLGKVTSARDQAHATIAKLEAERRQVLEEAHAVVERQLAESAPDREKERQQLEARMAELREEHAAALATKDDLLEWNNRTISDLDDEVKSYRARIKVVLAERDALARDKALLAQQLEQAAAAAKEPAREAPRAQEVSAEALQERITKMMAANGELIRALATLSLERDELWRALEDPAGEPAGEHQP